MSMYHRGPRPKEAPLNYVAGLGRGATGFTTRSDIGPARAPTDPADKGPPGYVAGRGRGADSFGREEDPDMGRMNQTALDDNESGLFAGTTYDADDAEADAIWDAIDERMDSQRKDRREKKERAKVAELRRERPKIQAQFASLKADLGHVTFEEWESLREPGAHARQKRQKIDRYTPVPTSLLEQARVESQVQTTVDYDTQMGWQSTISGFATPGFATPGFATPGFATPGSGFATPGFATSGYATSSGYTSTPWGVQTGIATGGDVPMVGHAKQTIMRAKLEQASDSVTGQTSINPKGYLTDLAAMKFQSAAEVGDIKIATKLLDSVCKANPNHAPGWIARARLSESAGKLSEARKIITTGYKNCPKSQDVWLEAARLHEPEESKIILGNATREIPTSVPIWLAAAGLETEVKRKQRVLRKALETIPNSPKLWKAAVELYEPAEAREMLAHAVECIPTSVEMWLALAKLETYQNAKKVLNKACSTIPTEKLIWITAARLEEANENIAGVPKIISKAVLSLVSNGVQIDRDQWIKEAEQCEKNGSPETCKAIIEATIGQDVDEEDRKKIWCEDAEHAIARGSIQTARAIYEQTVKAFPGKKSLWLRMAQLEKRYGTPAGLNSVMSRAVASCPSSDILWLMYAKHKWMEDGNVLAAREILNEAFTSLPGNEKIWLAAVKLEKENDEYVLARAVLERARENAGTERVWMKSALLERDLQNTEEEKKLLADGLERFPKFHKLHLMLGQLYERKNEVVKAGEVYTNGIKNCPNSIALWLALCQLEERTSGPSRARAVLERARLKNPHIAQLWLEAVRIESRAGEHRVAMTMLAKGLQECPKSGILWAESIAMEATPAKKARSVDALKRCDQDPHVLLSVAILFWQNRQTEKARIWLKRTVALDPNFGDAWAYAYKFELTYGTPEQQQALVDKCVQTEPHQGEKWIAVSKDYRNFKLKTAEILAQVAQKIRVD